MEICMATIYDFGSLEGTLGRIVTKTVWAGYKAGVVVLDAVATVLAWQNRVRERRQLQMLDQRMLRDIGLTRVDIDLETRKPFWRS
jgi:uncharacterized protein YjiS (DUF1127 family)